MDSLSQETILFLQYLLPGFLAAWIFYGLTSYTKPSQFERVVQALIFTLFIRAFLYLLMVLFLYIGHYWRLGVWDESSNLIWSLPIAITIGLLFSYYANNDKIHRKLREKNITKETSFPSEWFGAFSDTKTWIVLHLHDSRRLYGWPKEWPSSAKNGHFVITYPSWLDDKQEVPIAGVKNILINVDDVKWVEFMTKPEKGKK
jgi:hypothetical protein